MAKTSVWNDVLGPFYAETGLTRHGIPITEDLIGLTTSDGETLYPHAQFDTLPDGSLQRREKVIQLWSQLIRPTVIEGVIDEWTATGVLLQVTNDSPSEAEIIAADDTQVDRVAQQITRSISHWRQ